MHDKNIHEVSDKPNAEPPVITTPPAKAGMWLTASLRRRPLLAALFVFAFASIGIIALLLARAASPIPSGQLSLDVGKWCLDNEAGIQARGNKVQLWICNSKTNPEHQQWDFYTDNTVHLRANAKYCLDVKYAGTAQGTPVWLWTCNGTNAQIWKVTKNNDGTVALVNPHANMCLDDRANARYNGNKIQIWSCNRTGAQNWTMPVVAILPIIPPVPPTPPAVPAPTVSLSATPTTVTKGNSATLTWSSTNSTACTASNAWTGSKATSGTASTGALNATATFTLTCSGSGGNGNASAVVNVSTASTTPGVFSIKVQGNHLVDGSGNTVVFHGVNRSGSEYACIQGWGIFNGPSTLNDDSQVPLMKNWGINEVNVPINEDCWLNINTSGINAAYVGDNYIAAIKHEVTTLENSGIYPVIALFWTAPGTNKATTIGTMPDADHSPALWQSVANTFKNDPAVTFRLYEEPHPGGNGNTAGDWQCWLNGGSSCSEGFAVEGMQSLINVVRATGATNVIQVPGIQYANSMTGFLANAPTDPNNSLSAAVDAYPETNYCGSTSCYDQYYAPVAAKYPFMFGEFGEDVYGNACGTSGVDTLMGWADQHAVGYSAWWWHDNGGCLQLVTDYTTGSPKANWGTDYKNHVLTHK